MILFTNQNFWPFYTISISSNIQNLLLLTFCNSLNYFFRTIKDFHRKFFNAEKSITAFSTQNVSVVNTDCVPNVDVWNWLIKLSSQITKNDQIFLFVLECKRFGNFYNTENNWLEKAPVEKFGIKLETQL